MSPFVGKDWRNATTHEGGGDESTPISAAALEDLETRVTDYADTMVGGGGVQTYDASNYGVVGDGSVDDFTALQNCLTAGAGARVHIPATSDYYKVTDDLVVPANTLVEGDYGGGWQSVGNTRIIKTNGDTNANRVMTLSGTDSVVRGICFQGPTTVDYLASTYPTGTDNPSYGIWLEETAGEDGCRIENCRFTYFKAAGVGGEQFQVTVDGCTFWVNLRGIDWTSGDSLIQNSIFIHNVHSGARVLANYNRIINNRFEWNKRYGLLVGDAAGGSGSDTQITSNLFDRNGWSGLYLGGWHCPVVGNIFRRNGAGGDGTVGLTAAHTTTAQDSHGNVMYLAPATENDHASIQLQYGKYATIVGNDFDHGQDDAAGGADGPKYTYSYKTTDSCVVGPNSDLDSWNEDFGGAGLGAIRYVDSNVEEPYAAGEPWTIDIDPFLTVIDNYNWTTLTVDAAAVKGSYRESAGEQNNYLKWNLTLTPGTYTFSLLHNQDTDRGIYSVSWGATTLGTIDGYAAAPANAVSTIASIVVTDKTTKVLQLTMATKHASSSSYVGAIMGLGFRRTA